MKLKTLKKIFKVIILLILLNIIILNYFRFFIKKDIYTVAKSNLFSQSLGQNYFGRLSLWHLLIQNGDWDTALILESKLDNTDILKYKIANQPQELQKSLNILSQKTDKIADDWIEMSRIQSILGNIEESKIAIQKAYQIDPIRDDISKLYYQLQP